MELQDLITSNQLGLQITLETLPFLIPQIPVLGRCFFTGPLFDGVPMEKFAEFYTDIRAPVDLLRDEKRRKRLARNLKILRGNQSFFSVNGESENLLEELSNEITLYNRFKMQRGKKLRDFAVPKRNFEYLLREYILPFVKSIPTHICSHGGERYWNPRKSLETHLPVKSGICFDMKDAFGQATIDYVFSFFYQHLKGFSEEERVELAGTLATLTTVKTQTIVSNGSPFLITTNNETASTRILPNTNQTYDACLPQGSILSMAIFNRMMYPVDEDLYKAAKKANMTYTRWVDDFVVTSHKPKKFDHFEKLLTRAQRTISIAPQKVFFHYRGSFYALGHRIDYNEIEKLEKEEFERRRGEPFCKWMLEGTHPRGNMIYGEELDWEDEADLNNPPKIIRPEKFTDDDPQMRLPF